MSKRGRGGASGNKYRMILGKATLLLALVAMITWTSYFLPTWKEQWHSLSANIFSRMGETHENSSSFVMSEDIHNFLASHTLNPCAAEVHQKCPIQRKLLNDAVARYSNPYWTVVAQEKGDGESRAGNKAGKGPHKYTSGVIPASEADISGVIPASEAGAVVLWTYARCGSTWMYHVLGMHESINVIGELFFIYGFDKLLQAGEVRSRGHFLDLFMSCNVFHNKYLGYKDSNHEKKQQECLHSQYRLYKLLYSQIRTDILEWHQQHNTSIIHLVRRNVFGRGVSVEHLQKQNLATLGRIQAQGGLENLKLRVDVNKFIRQMERYIKTVKQSTEALQNLGIPHVTVYYEDLLDSEKKDKSWNEIMDLLNLPHSPFPGKSGNSTGQIHSVPDYENEIINYEEVAHAVKEKGWSWML